MFPPRRWCIGSSPSSLPAGIVSGDTGVKVPLLEVVLKLTLNALATVAGLPKASSNATVIIPEATPAVNVCDEVVNAKWLAAAAVTVSCCVADVKLPAAAAIVGVPADVSV